VTDDLDGPLPSARPRLSIEPDAPASARELIEDAINERNMVITGVRAYWPVAIFLRGQDDEILGGVLGDIWGGWLHVSFLWVAEELRGQGHGTTLLRQAEAYALARGCANVYLETHSFQARPFYEKLGYEVFGTLEAFPPGHAKYFLRKRLSM
jgi:GNAT superfamily N-acetyltransferase